MRYVALTLNRDGVARLVEKHDALERVLAEAPIAWELDRSYRVSVTTRRDGTVTASVDGGPSLAGGVEPARASGAVGLLAREGHCQFGAVRIVPV
jgi:hypothetical protein